MVGSKEHSFDITTECMNGSTSALTAPIITLSFPIIVFWSNFLASLLVSSRSQQAIHDRMPLCHTPLRIESCLRTGDVGGAASREHGWQIVYSAWEEDVCLSLPLLAITFCLAHHGDANYDR